MEDIFKKASKIKLRFNYNGNITVDDLWDLSVQSLDEIYRKIKKELGEYNGESLLSNNKKSTSVAKLELAAEIVKEIVADKLAEKEKRESEAKKKAQNQKILEIIAKKKDDALESLSVEELEKLLLE